MIALQDQFISLEMWTGPDFAEQGARLLDLEENAPRLPFPLNSLT